MGCVSLFAPALVWGLSEEEIGLQIQTVISMRHPTDTGSWWKSLGPEAPHVIISMYQKTDTIYQQIRLLDALAWYDSSESALFLKQVVEKSKNQTIKDAALHSLVRSQGLKEKEYITDTLDHGSLESRISVAKALSEQNEPEASQIVERYLETEKVSWAASKVQSHRLSVRQRRQEKGRSSSVLVTKPRKQQW
jgi:hypothetical protein